ncbi:hypothetical protein BU17DRAFT_55347 [Hysterangium stoloniferum]|nr:hypothetical protein BU17DRAFT_55347 [Hysterangium stoloniferum]
MTIEHVSNFCFSCGAGTCHDSGKWYHTSPSFFVRSIFIDLLIATERAWEQDYVGTAVEGLELHIKKYYGPSVEGTRRMPHAHYTSIVQSSGMGKSRLVDEFAKSHFVIRMNLRRANAGGFPPPDDNFREFLVAKTDRAASYRRAYAFLVSLFITTKIAVNDLRTSLPGQSLTLETLAAAFREFMTKGQTMVGPGPDRKFFYDNVIQRAKQVYELAGEVGSAVFVSPEHDSHKDEIISAARGLRLAIEDLGYPESPLLHRTRQQEKQNEPNFPIIFLEFDEAHLLTDKETFTEEGYSHLSELRRVLRMMHFSPVFSFFLSTTEKISLTPFRTVVSSTRLLEGRLHTIPSYMDLGFDQAMKGREACDGSHTIDQVAELGFMAHFGRPLFGTRYDAVRDRDMNNEILQFAQLKLLNCEPSRVPFGLTKDQRLACLSVRLALEFNSTTFTGHRQEQEQVEGHMRVCLSVDESFESMKTVSPSEPILAEAAAQLMYGDYGIQAPEALKSVLEDFSIYKGDRGELLGLLLLCLARDMTIYDEHHPTRVGTVFHFMSNLFNNIKNNHTFGPSMFDKQEKRNFKRTFENSWIYFSHFIKVPEYKITSREYLTALIFRGAAILFANNQKGIDAIIPFLYEDKKIQRTSVSVILVQLKNDPDFTDVPRPDLFPLMDPYRLGIFKKNEPPIPIIRIVFALASPREGFTRMPPSKTSSKFTSFDFWSAGLSTKFLGPISTPEQSTWEALLQASRPWNKIYEGHSTLSDLRRSENPGAGVSDGHWSNWYRYY